MDNYYEGNRKSEDARMHASTPTATFLPFIHFSIHPISWNCVILETRVRWKRSSNESIMQNWINVL